MRECKLCKLTSYMSIQEMLCWENVMFSILNTGSFIHLYVHVCACIIARGIRACACEFDIVFASLSCCVCALQQSEARFQNHGQQRKTHDIILGHKRRGINHIFECIYTSFQLALISIIQSGNNLLTCDLFRGCTLADLKLLPICCSLSHTL